MKMFRLEEAGGFRRYTQNMCASVSLTESDTREIDESDHV